MDRREFLKFSSLLSAALAACGRTENHPMATNGNLLARALRGEKLLESELMQLEFALDGYDRSKVFVDSLQNGTGKLNVSEINSRFGYFEKLPSFPFAVAILNPNTQTIANNTETVIDPSYNDNDNPQFQFVSATNRIRLRVGNRKLGILGTIQWASNGTGRRAIHVKYYALDGSLLGAKTMHSMMPTGVSADTFPFANVLEFGNAVEFEFTVIQTSGGNLDIQFFQAHTFLVE